MICKRYVAVRTMRYISATATRNKCRKSTPVKKQNCLFTAFQIFFDFVIQFTRKHTFIALFQLAAHINNRYFGHFIFIVSCIHFKQLIFACLCFVIAFNRRRCRRQDNRRTKLTCSEYCRFACVVSR